jgi:hypothetical protein
MTEPFQARIQFLIGGASLYAPAPHMDLAVEDLEEELKQLLAVG